MRWAVLLIVLSFGTGLGGPVSLQADTVPHRLFTAFDGLPSENVTALAQSPSGLLWVGTETGVAVYDGRELRRVELPDSIGTTYISAIEPLPDGSVWVTPSLGEAIKMRHSGVERAVELGDRIVQQILVRRDTLVFVTRTAVWHLLPGADTARRQPFQYDIRPSGVENTKDVGAGIFNAAIGPEGGIWVLDGHLGPGRLRDDGSVSFLGTSAKAPGNFWYDIQFAADGTGLLLQGEQLHRLDPENESLEVVFGDLGDPTYLSVEDNRAYVTRNWTLLRYDVETQRVLPSLGPSQGLPERTPVTVLRDQEEGLWIGTREGLLHLMAPEARTVKAVDGRPLVNVFQFLNRGTDLWALTYGSGIVQLRPDRRLFAPDGLVGWRQRVYSRDERLHAIATKTRDWYRRSKGKEWERIGSAEGAEGGVVGPDGYGYFLHEDGIYRHRPGDTVASKQLAGWPADMTHAHDLAFFPNGDLLHRAGDQLLRRRRPGGTILDTVAVLSEGPERNISQLLVDSEGRIWCAYRYGGLLRVDPGAGEQRLILEDEPFWGIEMVDERLLLASTRQAGAMAIDPQTGAVRRQFTRADGLRSNTVMTSLLTADTLYFGHGNGITRIPARELDRSPSAPPTLLMGLEVNFEDRLPSTADSVLSATERSVGFEYSAPSLSRADRIHYEVRLRPRDTTWDATSRRFTRYTNLEPGTYRFEVRARLANRGAGPITAHSFTIPPRFYETVWFRILGGLVVLGLVLGAYRWRTYRLRRRQEELETAVNERTRQLQDRTEELAEEKQKTERQAERLAELDEAKNRFFAHISHEFRTPLSLILSPLRDALQRAAEGAATLSADQLRRMTNNAERLQRLIDQLLDLATLEAGRMELDRRPGDVAGLVQRAAEAFRSKAEEKGIALRLEGTGDRVPALFDPEKVETIVSNLVGNAVKFTPEEGAVTVRIEKRDEAGTSGLVEAPEEGDSVEGAVRIEVEDTGPGIAPDVQETIFDRFEQADTSRTRNHEGTGLGLALTSELVDLHGGTVDVASAPGEGSRFVVHLPLVPVATESVGEQERGSVGAGERGSVGAGERGSVGAGERGGVGAGERGSVGEQERGSVGGREQEGDGRAEPTEEEKEKSRGEEATILVVEDNAEMRSYLREELGQRWSICEAADGEEGWQAVREEEPDLVISDVMMPSVDGFELCRRIKGDEALRTIPVLLLTARAEEEATLEGLGCGADDYVAKPFGVEELKKRIENHLKARRYLEARYREEVVIEGMEAVVEAEERPFVEEVLTAIDEGLSNPDFGVSDLAEAVALSRRQLTRRLKKTLGRPPGDLIGERRMERAKVLLEEADRVSEVAHAVGFRSASAFSQSFQKAVGLSPSEYAQRESGESTPGEDNREEE